MNTPAKVTLPRLLEWKKNNRKISALTAYDYNMARYLDAAGIDIVLVGDSLGMVSLGHSTTLPVTMDDMIHHTRAVRRGLTHALLVADMPFLSYQVSVAEALHNAGRFLQEAGAEAVKLEGGARVLDRVRAIVQAGIPVMGHLGLTPQSVHQFGGYRVQGRDYLDARQIRNDALELQNAGAFALVLEAVPLELAAEITAELEIPTLGIGAGPHCDGQILVTQDMLGMNPDFTPKFVKKFGAVGSVIEQALQDYIGEVRDGTFPGRDHSYRVDPDNLRRMGKAAN